MNTAVDYSLALAWLVVLAYVLGALRPRRGPRHRWGELDSSDVASSLRRRRR